MKIVVVIIALMASFAASQPVDLSSIINEIPENERMDFLKFHIMLGHALIENNYVSENMDMPNSFSINLYKQAKENIVLLDEVTQKQMREIICFDDGVCIDVGDIGVHPRLPNV